LAGGRSRCGSGLSVLCRLSAGSLNLIRRIKHGYYLQHSRSLAGV